MGMPGPMEIAIILVIALLVFGPKRLPEIGRTIGKLVRDVQRMMNNPHEDPNDSPEEEKPKTPNPKS